MAVASPSSPCVCEANVADASRFLYRRARSARRAETLARYTSAFGVCVCE